MIKKQLFRFLPLGLAFCLIAYLYLPFLLNGLVQIHGDGVVFGVPMLHLLKQSLAAGELPLWTDLAYGGHPVFAESQIGALNPINMLVATMFEPIIGQTVYHIICMVGSAIGMFLLARQLNISAFSAGFAVIALVFSTLWLGTQNNLTVSAAAMWTPFVLWSFERLWLRVDISSMCLFSMFATLMVFSGYPHFVHGVALYLVVRVLATLFIKDDLIHIKKNIRSLLIMGALAIFFTISLSAAQLLPLAELAASSHRSDGVGFLEAPPVRYVRGFLFTLLDHGDEIFKAGGNQSDIHNKTAHFNVTGSIIVCFLATYSLFAFRHSNVLPHFLAVFLLLNLAFSNSSPLFRVIYEYHLLPGLHQFRIMIPYFHVAIVGFCLLAAFGLDFLSKLDIRSTASKYKLALGLFLLSWIILLVDQVNTYVSWYHFIAPALLLVCAVMKQRFSKLPLQKILFLALILEVLLLRMVPFKFGSPDLLKQPKVVDALFSSELKEYKHIDNSILSTYGMMNPLSDRVAIGLLKAQTGLSPTINVLWGVPSLDGGMALQLGTRELIEKELRAEISDIDLRVNGTRLIDTLSVKYITGGYLDIHDSLPEVYYSSEQNVYIFENISAMPKFRIYQYAQVITSPEQALLEMAAVAPEVMLHDCIKSCISNTTGKVDYRILSAAAMYYDVELDAAGDGWFFIADANYPGWNAYIDGVQVAVHSAQILGKSVYIPQGSQRLELKFEPKSVYYGLISSFIALVLMTVLMLKQRFF
jgi:hypothetical protein